MIRTPPSLNRSVNTLAFLFLVIAGLYFAKEFLIPVAISGLLAMLFAPVCRWLEGKGLSRTTASLLCVLLLILGFGFIIWLLSWQASSLVEDLSNIGRRFKEIFADLRQYIAQTLGISVDKQKELVESQSQGGGSQSAITTVGKILAALVGISVNTILILVYLFLFISCRSHIKKFILMLVPETDRNETERIIRDGGKVAQKYISGMSMMIVLLWIMYGIGFSIVGIEYAIFFAILCGLLEIIPFIGNLTGTSLTLLMVISQGGSGQMIIGVVITYLLVQFIQSYIIEPLVVGSEVNINPLFTILGIVVFELVWGVGGMILAIPIMGIIKIICDHITPLKPYGFLIGTEKKERNSAITETIAGWFGSKGTVKETGNKRPGKKT